MSTTPDVENLIARLCGPLSPCDRSAFRHDAEAALAALTIVGDGSIYRALVPLWRRYFVPLPDGRHDPNQHLGRSKLANEPPIARSSRSDEL
jgi:hypothetical protein